MADVKGDYSNNAAAYNNNTESKTNYERSKSREAKYNINWKNQSINLNEIVEKFALNANGEVRNGKYIYFGEKYNVIADMPSGYVRIMELTTKKYVKLNGKPGSSKETHFKIKKREEM